MSDQPSLKRSLGLTQIVLYGAGTILGAGIYVLVGEVIGVSGNFAPMAFLLAALIVAFSAYSFGVLSAAFPVSAGPAAYTEEAFRSRGLATTVGYAIIASGVISAATITRGFVGYLDIFTTLPNWISICLFVTIMAAIALRGVNTSVGLAVAITLLEISGLVLVVISAWDKLPEAWHNLPRYFLPTQKVEFEGIAIGAFLAFYACIGFEDMVNMAEEVKNPERNLPIGIIIVLLLTTLLYVLVALAALVSVPIDSIANSTAPLALVIEHNGLIPVAMLGVISMAAVTNGALIQIIMGSRVLYGMAGRNLAPRLLAKIHVDTRIPHLATIVVAATVLLFALALPLITLAKLTSGIVLSVFALVNLSLIIIKFREGDLGIINTVIPLTGAILCVFFIGAQWLYG